MCDAKSTTNSNHEIRATDSFLVSFAATFDATSTAKTFAGVHATYHQSWTTRHGERNSGGISAKLFF
jgi:hypothetical protein